MLLREPARQGLGAGLARQTGLKANLGYFADHRGVFLPLYGALALFAMGISAATGWGAVLLTRTFGFSIGAAGKALGSGQIVWAIIGALLASDDGANLLVAYRRAANIVRIEEKKDGKTYAGAVTGYELGAPEAAALLEALDGIDGPVQGVLEKEAYSAAMTLLAQLRAPVDAFFDKVTVNTDNADQRAARLKLLSRIVSTMNQVADFSKVEG